MDRYGSATSLASALVTRAVPDRRQLEWGLVVAVVFAIAINVALALAIVTAFG